MSLFAVAAFLLFLIQCLRLFDVVSDKGQNLLTLLGQAVLAMPALGIVFLYVCLGIGLGRALRNLEARNELQIIHVSGLVPALLRAVGLFMVLGTLAVLLLSHVVDPLSVRSTNDWTARIAADLVSRSMIPNRFVETVPGVTMVIGDRDSSGNIQNFFADDSRDPDTRRSYFARSAIIVQDEQGYVLRMHDGAVQYYGAESGFSQISFTSYDLALDNLTSASSTDDPQAQTTSIELIGTALAKGEWDGSSVKALLKRTGEGVRVIAMCLLVVALAAFPSGKRRRLEIPIELVVLGASFIERGVSSYLPGPGPFGAWSGSFIMIVAALLILALRLRVFRPVFRARTA